MLIQPLFSAITTIPTSFEVFMGAGQLILNPPYFCAQITDFGAGSDAKFPVPGARTGGRMSQALGTSVDGGA